MPLKKAQFSIGIAAPKEKVWRVLWDDATYRKWTSVFSEGSYAVSDWKEGSRVLFLNEEGSGMFSKIAKMVPDELMSFIHLGEVKDGKEQPADPVQQSWAGATENYSLHEKEGITTLMVTIDVTESHTDYFNETFPKALRKVKELAEEN